MRAKPMKKKQMVGFLIPYLKKEKLLLSLTIFLCLATSVLSATTPFITKAIFDEFLPDKNYEMIIVFAILYGVVIVALVLARYFFQFVNTLTGMRIEKKIREEAMRKINYLPVDYFSLEPDGKIVAKITSDSGGVRIFYTTMFSIINAVMNIAIVYIGIIIIKPILGLLILIVLPILLLWITLYRKWVHKYHVNLRETGSQITGKLNEDITGSLIIQDFNQEDIILDEYQDLVKRYVKNDRTTANINNMMGFELLNLIKRMVEIALLLFLGFSSINVMETVITIGMVSAIVESLDKMINPFETIFNNLNELEDSIVGATRVHDFILENNDTKVFDGEIMPDSINGDIEFKDVKFAYVKDNYVLNGVNLKVNSGESIGIVGHTGSGKSSLMNLLLRYNDYNSGSILIDGEEINKYNKMSYRHHMGIVLQSPALFKGTLKSNITMERDYSDNEVIDALKSVGGEYLINKSPDGINMPISFRGENLSLGEKQLISFARILLRNPKILVLDEATANIDSETETAIKKATFVVSKNRTTFIIAHRLSTIKECDKIVVLDHGNIVGIGKHDDLYINCDVYKNMYDSQYKGLK
ncbi:MAG: ABC transporter ATP-binding protein [Acholeplasmatales bacterium]|nr:ABC transporter ATP-binding protein [Acholeplasmatales bacterium]